jgi:hypothetical protein
VPRLDPTNVLVCSRCSSPAHQYPGANGYTSVGSVDCTGVEYFNITGIERRGGHGVRGTIFLDNAIIGLR